MLISKYRRPCGQGCGSVLLIITKLVQYKNKISGFGMQMARIQIDFKLKNQS